MGFQSFCWLDLEFASGFVLAIHDSCKPSSCNICVSKSNGTSSGTDAVVTIVSDEFGLYQDSTFQSLEPSRRYSGLTWRYRLPGRGCANWPLILHFLADNGYTGGISIELEDDDFLGSELLEKRTARIQGLPCEFAMMKIIQPQAQGRAGGGIISGIGHCGKCF